MGDTRFRFSVKQVEAEIEQLFAELIDVTDYEGRKANQKKDAFSSRALAAYALHILAEVDPNTAAKAIVDGPDDNGIDALLFHKRQNILWLVQSKWVQDGQSPPSKGDLEKFKSGVFDLLDFTQRRERFNDKFEIKEDEIISALSSPGLKIKVVIAYTGPELSKHGRRVIQDCIDELNNNDINDGIASHEVFNLDRAFKAVTESHREEDIEVKFSLSNWGRVDEPYLAIYGQVAATDVARWWIEHKNRLFSKNIRNFIGESTVNTEIKKTLEQEPELFWYLNNGVTVLCKSIIPIGHKKDRRIGEFVAKDISVVNGAQTIGSIAALYQDSSQERREELEAAEIFIRFISLDKCLEGFGLGAEDFGLKVTRATNTQNRVEIRDFVALDPQQERLYKEFRSNGRNYHYKRTAETFIKNEKNYELEEATVTLACANEDAKLLIMAKQDLSKLWSDTSGYPYTAIFNSNVNAIQLWRQIDIKREVEKIIKDRQEHLTRGIEADLIKYGNLAILHFVFKQVKREIFSFETSERDFMEFVNFKVPKLVDVTVKKTVEYLEKNGKTSRVWMLFKNSKRINDIKKSIIC